MAITIKSAREIALMTEAGKILEEVHEVLKDSLRVGMSTLDIDKIGEAAIRKYDCIPSFLNYNGYPASICVSVNDEVVHGIPSAKRIIGDGDMVGLDAGVCYKGYHSDAARTYIVGTGTKEVEDLIQVTKQSFFEGIKFAKEGYHVYDISAAIGAYVEQFGYGVVRDLTGHGIGAKLHESPDVPNFKQHRRGPKLRAGMVLAIEPMINMGTHEVWWLEDDWTVVTRDGKPSAHYENTVLITEGEPILLTLNNR